MNLTDEDKSWMKRNCCNDLFMVYVLLIIIVINSCDNDSKIRVVTGTDGANVLEIKGMCNYTNLVKSVRVVP